MKYTGYYTRHILLAVVLLTTLASQVALSQDLSNGLVAHYPFNGNANDESSFGNDGTANGATLTTDRFGTPNSTYDFDGSDNIVVSDDASLRITEAVSMSAWVYLESTDGNDPVLIKENNHYGLYVVNNKVMFYGNSGEPAAVGGVFDKPAPSTFNGSIPLSLNQWHHIAVTTGGIGSVAKIYVDGVLDASVGQIKNFGPESSHSQLEIGSEVSSGNRFIGSIDDVRIYNRALTETEVQALHSLVAYYPFNDPFNGIAVDESGNGNDGTVNGATPTSDRFGTPNSAYSFNGAANHIVVPHSPELNLTGDFSFSAWVLSDVQQSANNFVIGKGASPVSQEYTMYFTNGDNKPRVSINSASVSNNHVQPNLPLPTDRWIHIAAVAEAGVVKLYIDGVEVASRAYTYSSTGSNLFIGALAPQFYRGSIDEVRIYDRALSGTEVQDLCDFPQACDKSISLIQPNGGEVLAVGDQYEVQWTTTGPISAVNLYHKTSEASTDWNSGFIAEVPTSPGMTHTYTWTVPNTPSNEVRFRIIDRDDSGVDDRSDNVFTIEANNTPPGPNVEVTPVDETTGTSPVTLTFDNVTQGGTTTLTTSGPGGGPDPPEGFIIRGIGQPIYYELSTTAVFTGTVTVCIDYSGISVGSDNNLKLFHRENNVWTDITTSHDTVNDILCGETTSFSLFALFEENIRPTVDAISVPTAPINIDQPVTGVSATFSDPAGTFDEPYTCTVDYSDGSGLQDGTVNGTTCDGPDHTYADAGVYTITVEVTDKHGTSGSAEATEFIVIYDPDGGFVTGGGWIISVAGAYLPDPTLTGRANFGFVSKYKNGAQVPIGETEFQFKVADLNFHSDSYEWLVVAHHKAKYKGEGMINGGGNYGFQISAIDEALTPSTDDDLFRIKIWDKDNSDALVYDNQVGADDEEDPTTEIDGGNIKIHDGHGPSKADDDVADAALASEAPPEAFALLGNYPNPFNPQTTLKIEVPEASEISLTVYDMLGREVRVLVEGKVAAGRHEAVFEAGDLPSGLYVARLVTPEGTFTQKMLLLK